jgi:predicted permease
MRGLTRLLNFAARRRADDRLREEMEAHLALQTEENLRAGMTPSEARRQARLKFGGAEAIREAWRDERSLPFLENLLLDVRYGLRVLRRSPAFALVAAITLMLGIGANVVVFGVLNAVLLRPLGVSDPSTLYQLRRQQWTVGKLLTTSYPAFEDYQRRNTAFSGLIGVYGYSSGRLRWRNTVLRVRGDDVTTNYFDVLGAQPAIGRFFHASDERTAPYLVLSDALWRKAFHADPAVVGTTVEFNKRPLTVIGVAPASFHGAERFVWPDYWLPMTPTPSRSVIDVTVLGRLKAGVTPQWATDNLNAISAQLAKEYPETDDGQPLRLVHPGLLGDEGDVIRRFLYSVTLLALLVLAAACANLATLFAARTADRSRELALRVALGSSRGRLVRQLLTEAVLVSLLGGAAGLLTAKLVIAILNRSAAFAGALTVAVDARVYLAGFVLTLASALLFGMAPAWQAGPKAKLRLRRFALRDVLLGVQIAICTLLVTGSLVAVRGMVGALHVPLGFEPQGAMLANVDLSESSVKPEAILTAMRGLPGVTTAGTISRTPFTGGLHGVPVFRPGTTEFKLQNSVLAPYVFSISPGYLDSAGTRLLAGRDVSPHDTSTTPYVAIVNQTFASRMWPGVPAMGQRFIVRGNLTEVVGIAEDGKYHDLQESPQPAAYIPVSQSEPNETVFIVRSHPSPREIAAALRQTLTGLAPNASITVQNWSDDVAGQLFAARAATVALGAMGLLAAMLSVTGIFGMAAYTVSRRRKELGIRVALGARKTQVLTAAVGRPIVLLGAGSLLGLLSGVFASRLLNQIVYHANPRDPVVVGGAVLTMALLGVAASAIPAWRALAIDPSRLMHED